MTNEQQFATLQLHESMTISSETNDKGGMVVWTITKVHGGWIYSNQHNHTGTSATFVPYPPDQITGS